jgi:large subunit ribosomal protein L24
MSKLHIKKGDKVKVLSGESKNKVGTVIKVYPDTKRAIVEGEEIKKASKHTKPNAANPQGGIVQQDAPIHISNLMVVDSKGVASKTGRKMEEGKTVRFNKKSGEVIK